MNLKIIAAVGTPIVVFVIILITQIPAVAIYADFFEKKDYEFGTVSPPTVTFQNNDFLSNVAFNSLFLGSVKIINSTGDVDC